MKKPLSIKNENWRAMQKSCKSRLSGEWRDPPFPDLRTKPKKGEGSYRDLRTQKRRSIRAAKRRNKK